MSMNYETAVELATRAHAGQRDRQGVPYIGHPIRVAANARRLATAYGLPDPEVAEIVAVLHDTIEDTDITASDLREAGATEEQIAAVVALSRPEGVTYADFIGMVIEAGPLPMIVKLADIADNTDPVRASGSNEGLAKRYARASVRLRSALNAWEHSVR